MQLFSSFFGRAYLVLALALIAIFASLRMWESKKVIEWDVTLYYSYLPATFIYHDIEFNKREPMWDEALFFMNTDSLGNRYVKMTSGLAYLYSPFFFGAHAVALSSSRFEANGFTVPYRCGLLLSDLCFALLGLWFLGKLLMRWFSQKVAFISVAVIFAGTNMAYYTFFSPMSHVYNFALVSMILFWFFKYLDSQKIKHIILLGLASGLLVLIRPTNILALLLPLTFLISKRKEISWPVFSAHAALGVLLAGLVWIPQLLYWKYMTGSWLVYSYNDESFFFFDPEIWKGLFGYRKGWLVYSPVLLFSFIGFGMLFKNHRTLAAGSAITVTFTLWVTFSWWCWWYGGGFGARPLIDFLPFMALPLAALLQWLFSKKWWGYGSILLVMGYFCFTSIFMTNQYRKGIIHFDAMSKELFWKQYLVNHYIYDYEKYLDPPDYKAAARNEE